jgi:hypothetical protein
MTQPQIAPIQYAFDVSGIDPYVGGGAPLPSATYLMHISNMEVKANKDAATGHNLALEYSILDGEHKGRKYFENLNLWHTASSAAVEIANKQLSSIGHAVAVLSGNDPTVLCFKPMLVELELTEQQPDKVNPNTGDTIKGRGPQNRVVRRDPVSAQASAVPGQVAQQVAPAAAAANAAPTFNPAQQQVAAPAAAQGQQAPAFAAAQQAAPAAQAAPAGGPAVPPWQK